MSYRVIQWSTGNVGTFALRCIVGHPELELAGVWAHSTAKAGKDAGELCGLGRVGVCATTDGEALLALDADCVCYTATADLRPFEAVEDVARILASGKDVVSSSIVPLVHPQSFFPEVREKLEDACRRGGTSFFTSGVDPGFANDVLPLTLSGLCERWEEIRILEIKGTPAMRSEFEFADERGDHAVGGVLLTATRLVNAIPAVCRARPGLLSALDLPLVTGRGLWRRMPLAAEWS